MALCSYTYHRPASIIEACALLHHLGPGALYLAGGTELLPDFRRGTESASHLVSLGGVPELVGIAADSTGLRIGAMTTVGEVAASAEIRKRLPALTDAALSLGSPQIRSRATIGGNFCRAVPCADTAPPCIAAGATLRLVKGSTERIVPAEAFFVAPRQTILQPGELLTEILIPPQPRSSGVSFQRFALRRGSALAVASVAVRLVLDVDRIAAARVALGSVAPVPLLAVRAAARLEGQAPTPEVFAGAAQEAASEARPITDLRGSEAFRRHLVDVLMRRALDEALRRAQEQAL